MTDQLDISVRGRLGRIVLNRPQAINALSLPMIEGIMAVLGTFADDPAVGAVLFEGIGPRGFCAGGDVRAARALVLEDEAGVADAYFAAEYRMDGLIAGFPKPTIALTHGIVMGGGIGIAGHCRYRITQPGARFAMPESGIGFFADVGVNAILAKAPVNRALLFLLSGVSVGVEDALALGLADAVVAAERIEALRDALAGAAGAANVDQAVVSLIQADQINGGRAPFCAMADLLPTEVPASLSEFIDAVRSVPALAEIAALLDTRSPSAMTTTFHGQMAARRLMDVHKVLALDLRLARLAVRSADFAEGVRAVLVDKDQSPKWQPVSLAEIDEAAFRRAVEMP